MISRFDRLKLCTITVVFRLCKHEHCKPRPRIGRQYERTDSVDRQQWTACCLLTLGPSGNSFAREYLGVVEAS